MPPDRGKQELSHLHHVGASCASSCQRERHSNTLTEIYCNTDQFSAFHPDHGRGKSLPLTAALNKAECLPLGKHQSPGSPTGAVTSPGCACVPQKGTGRGGRALSAGALRTCYLQANRNIQTGFSVLDKERPAGHGIRQRLEKTCKDREE